MAGFTKKINSGFLFLVSLLFFLVITPLFQQGLFGDGLLYLTVAFNRFRGYGSFWEQRFSETSMKFFCEQPPLYFESLGNFYKLFEGNELAEKCFTLFLLVVTIWLIWLTWKKLAGEKYTTLGWLPSLLLLSVPVFSWAYSNQVIETMVVPLSLLALYFYLIFLEAGNRKKKLFSFVLIFVLLFLLLITKGIQSAFLLVAFFLAGISVERKNFKRMFFLNVLLAVCFAAICFLVFFSSEKAHFWLTSYFQKRIIATFHNVGATADYREEIIVRYFSELVPAILFFFIVSIFVKRKLGHSFGLQWKKCKSNKTALWLLLISFSASLPMALTLEQRGFYLTPSFPFAILGFSLLYKRYVFVLLAKLISGRDKILLVLSSLTVVASLVFFFIFKNDFKRDEGMIKDVRALKKIIPYGTIIGIDQSTWNNFSLHAYLNKENNNSLLVSDTTFFYIQEKENKARVPAQFIKLGKGLVFLNLYENSQKKR